MTTVADTARPLRLWPGVALVAVQWLAWWVVPRVAPDATFVAVLTSLACGPALLVWWAFFSRARWPDRLGGVVLVIAAMAATPSLLHESVAKGNMGFQFFLWAIPFVSLALVASAVIGRGLADGPRRAIMAAAILLACGAFMLLRSKGVTGDGMPEFTWRWTPTAEEQLLAHDGELPASAPAATTRVAPPAVAADQGHNATPGAAPETADAPRSPLVPEPTAPATAATKPAAWPGFRGPHRDGVVAGLKIATDWTASPPALLWRRPIGPGVSSFAVQGGRLYTHEQRGEEEIVAGYDLANGEPLWTHRDAARFWDSHVGAGPRATPALGDGRVFTLGATGILNALDAGDGALLWTRDVAIDAGGKRPLWGFVSSPLLVDGLVIVHAGALAAYDAATGEPRWRGAAESGSYSSPHLLTLGGVPQVLLTTHTGVTSVAPADGTPLWEHAWAGADWRGIGVMQPVATADGDVLISMVDSSASPIGTRRLAVGRGPEGWTVQERWTSIALKPAFNQVVVHDGHAFGFDNRILSCIDVASGERKWKGGRYGSGQLLLLPEQDLLLVVTEQGELALVQAAADAFVELARFPAIEGRTWNQPALIGDVLLVRNGEEMAAFRLPRGGVGATD
ncbi:MAG: PQQ-like beta-propeller repeat protein [Vicinamibacteria bacterium]|nr:PQQ-like beta-propeller repeat protein [Vicinamibacteria bacterium]